MQCAKHNAEIYGVSERIHFQVGDAFELLKTIKETDCVFLSPPWVFQLKNNADDRVDRRTLRRQSLMYRQ